MYSPEDFNAQGSWRVCVPYEEEDTAYLQAHLGSWRVCVPYEEEDRCIHTFKQIYLSFL